MWSTMFAKPVCAIAGGCDTASAKTQHTSARFNIRSLPSEHMARFRPVSSSCPHPPGVIVRLSPARAPSRSARAGTPRPHQSVLLLHVFLEHLGRHFACVHVPLRVSRHAFDPGVAVLLGIA